MKTSSWDPVPLLNTLWVLGNLAMIGGVVSLTVAVLLRAPISPGHLWKLLIASALSQLTLTLIYYLKRKQESD